MRRLILIFALFIVVCPAFAQYPEPRWQWQPQILEQGFDLDRRLEQPVSIEILGRSAVAALKLLSEATGVDLGVSPENLTPLGERKLTVIAKGCTLKSIMVQIPEALQECHWRTDRTGPQPVYQLHRNAGVEATMKWLEQHDAARAAEKKRAERLGRLEDARKALAMTSEQLAELEKTDMMMARSARDPHARDMLEIVLSLPPEQKQRLEDTGRLTWDYARAPARLQKAANRIAEWFVARLKEPDVPKEYLDWRDHLPVATLNLVDNGTDHGWGVWLALDWETEAEANRDIHDVALQPRYPNMDEGELCFTRLLTATGTPDGKTAFGVVEDLDHAGFRSDDAKREERHKREWIEPTDPVLLQTIILGDQKFADFAEVHKFISDRSGLSIVSDYFTPSFFFIRDEARAPLPLWRLLYLLGEDQFWGDVYLWRKAGDVLIFRRADWYALARTEVPESLISACREKLRAQGEFTLDDVAEFAVALNGLGILNPALPGDLARELDYASHYNHWALLLYASLSPEQREKLSSPSGLSYADMTIAQRRQVVDRCASGRPIVPENDAAKAIFILAERSRETVANQVIFTQLELRFPGRTDAAIVGLRRPEAARPADR